MTVKDKPLKALTAGDMMSADVVRLPEEMSLRQAIHLLLLHQIGGAPVVDDQGKCVGVFSAIDFLRNSEMRADPAQQSLGETPLTCSFQKKQRTGDGKELTLCTLPPGVCPIQAVQEGPNGEKLLICSQPHCVLGDWQVVAMERQPTDQVRQSMTRDPVVAATSTPIRDLARMMIDAHIHRVIVVDETKRPIGVISSTNLLAALAYSEELQ